MEVIILDTPHDVAEYSAQIIKDQILYKPDSVLGLATGSTPVAVYEKCIAMVKGGELSFAHVRSFNLDEYLGLEGTHPQSYRYFMNTHLFDDIDIEIANTHIPNGMTQDPDAEAQHYENAISQSGGIDLQILGLGSNGHIGFNEPTSSLSSRTRVKSLTAQTIADNSRFFDATETQPTLCLTMGIGTIMDARKIVMIATGEQKSDAVATMIEGAISAFCPATALQMHQNVCVVLDNAAASQLQLKQYYLDAHTASLQ